MYESRYVMIDDSCCAHIPKCPSIRFRYEGGARVKYMDTLDVSKDDFEWFCPICIGEEEYSHLKSIIDRNDAHK